MPSKTIIIIPCFIVALSANALQIPFSESVLNDNLNIAYNIPRSLTKIIYSYLEPWQKIDQWSASNASLHHIVCYKDYILAIDVSSLTIRNIVSQTLTRLPLLLPECTTSRKNYILLNTQFNGFPHLASITEQFGGKMLRIYFKERPAHTPVPLPIVYRPLKQAPPWEYDNMRSEKYKYIQKCYGSHSFTLATTNQKDMRKISVWECGSTRSKMHDLYSKQPVKLLVFSPNGKYTVAVARQYTPFHEHIEMWNPSKWTPSKQLVLILEECNIKDRIQSIAVGKKGIIAFATASELITCKLLTPKDIKYGLTQTSHSQFRLYPTVKLHVHHRSPHADIKSLQFSHDGELIIAVNPYSQPNIQIMDSSTHKEIEGSDSINLYGENAPADTAFFAPDEKPIVGYKDGTIRVFERPRKD